MGYFKNQTVIDGRINTFTDEHRAQMDELFEWRPDAQVYYAKECGKVLAKVPERMVPYDYESYQYQLEKEAKEKESNV